jgi:hypothetical protein
MVPTLADHQLQEGETERHAAQAPVSQTTAGPLSSR